MWTEFVLFGIFAAAVVVLLRVMVRGKCRVCKTNVSLHGKVAIVTGGNTGIGFETALELARRKCKVIIACRDEERMNNAVIMLRKLSKNENVHGRKLDLASFSSVRMFAQLILQEEEKIQILVNNAGVLGIPELTLTKDGLEMHMAVNYFGHFLLTNLLLNRMESSGPSRIVLVSSMMHKFVKSFDVDDLTVGKTYNHVTAYNNSKLAVILMGKFLADKKRFSNLDVFTVNTGIVATDISRNLPYLVRLLRSFASPIVNFVMKTPEQGAQTSIMAAIDPSLDNMSGTYLSDCAPDLSSILSQNDILAQRIWEHSEVVTGLRSK